MKLGALAPEERFLVAEGYSCNQHRRLSGPPLESWVVWSSVPVTQAGTNVNEGEVLLRMKYQQLLAVAPPLPLQAG
jgi:hypothetical protein